MPRRQQFCLRSDTGLAGALAMSKRGDWSASILITSDLHAKVHETQDVELTDEQKNALLQSGTSTPENYNLLNGDYAQFLSSYKAERAGGEGSKCMAVSCTWHV